MTQCERGTMRKSGTVNAPARDVYELLEDWGGLGRWFPTDAAEAVECVERVEPFDKLPLARILHTKLGRQVRETLLVTSRETTRIYYTLADGSLPGVASYLATNMIDPISADRCELTFEAMFDVVDPALGIKGAQAMLDQIWGSLIGGIITFFDRKIS